MAGVTNNAKRGTEAAATVGAAQLYINQEHWFQPQVAIILGSGLGGLAEQLSHAHVLKYADIPGFAQTKADGHAGELLLGYLAAVPVVLMRGRYHRYEGHDKQSVEFPVRVMHALGAQTLIATNAAGGTNPRFQAGDLMAIDSHINWHGGGGGGAGVSPQRMSLGRGGSVYDFSLIKRSQQVARSADIVLHQGCYLATLGPTYETRAEYRAFRWMGADAVGMSTVPEVLVAHSLGMQVAAFSVITNVASTDLPAATTHDEVVESGKAAGPKLMMIVKQLLEDHSGHPD